MKIWELVSVTRKEPGLLSRLDDRWEWKSVADSVRQFEQLVLRQDRTALDASVPDDACRHVLAASTAKYFADNSYVREAQLKESDRVFSTLEVFNRYGGQFLEDVQEAGVAPIPSKVESLNLGSGNTSRVRRTYRLKDDFALGASGGPEPVVTQVMDDLVFSSRKLVDESTFVSIRYGGPNSASHPVGVMVARTDDGRKVRLPVILVPEPDGRLHGVLHIASMLQPEAFESPLEAAVISDEEVQALTTVIDTSPELQLARWNEAWRLAAVATEEGHRLRAAVREALIRKPR